ncbi:MAG: TetR family transcriptional regulator [Alphaproteobacteria bacterium]
MARSSQAKQERPARLDAEAWVTAAFDALAEGGVDAVRVEPLAKALGITKGSFYWHFADRRALLDAMLIAWAGGRIAAIREQATGRGAPGTVLGDLADLYTRHANLRGLTIELAIRSLARTDDAAAKAVRGVDRERLHHVGALFGALGWPGGEAQARAILFYSYLFGQSLLDGKVVPAATRDKAIRSLIAPP